MSPWSGETCPSWALYEVLPEKLNTMKGRGVNLHTGYGNLLDVYGLREGDHEELGIALTRNQHVRVQVISLHKETGEEEEEPTHAQTDIHLPSLDIVVLFFSSSRILSRQAERKPLLGSLSLEATPSPSHASLAKKDTPRPIQTLPLSLNLFLQTNTSSEPGVWKIANEDLYVGTNV